LVNDARVVMLAMQMTNGRNVPKKSGTFRTFREKKSGTDCPSPWGRFVTGTLRPGDASSRGRFVQGTDRPGDRSSRGRIIQGTFRPGTHRTGTDRAGTHRQGTLILLHRLPLNRRKTFLQHTEHLHLLGKCISCRNYKRANYEISFGVKGILVRQRNIVFCQNSI
jgi:hypothetical protein